MPNKLSTQLTRPKPRPGSTFEAKAIHSEAKAKTWRPRLDLEDYTTDYHYIIFYNSLHISSTTRLLPSVTVSILIIKRLL